MTTNTELALDDARLDDDAAIEHNGLETKSGRPGLAAPAIRTRPADPIARIAEQVTEQGRQIDDLARRASLTPSQAQKRLHEAKNRAVSEFRSTVDQRDSAAARGRRDVVVDDKITRINVAIDDTETAEVKQLRRENEDLKKRVARKNGPARTLVGASKQGNAYRELYRKASLQYLRTGQESFNGLSLRELATRAATSDSNPNGGFLVTPEHDTGPIDRLLSEASPMRQYATVRVISTESFVKPFNLGGTESGWVSQRGARPVTATPTLAEMRFPTHELYAEPSATQTLLDDARIDIEQWLAEEVIIKFAEDEGAAFVGGDGVGKPQGFIGGTTKVAEASWAHGSLGFVVTGGATGFASSTAFDAIIGLQYALKAGYRNGAAFAMNRATTGEVRKIKDGQNRYIWEPGGAVGEPSSVLGYPIIDMEEMPDLGADAFPIAFGNFNRGYLIVDHGAGLRVLRDPYSSKPYVLFYTTKRVGGGVQNFEAIKLLKCAA